MKQNYLLESIARSIAYDKTLKTKYTLMMQRQKKKTITVTNGFGANSIKKEIKCHRSATKIVCILKKKKTKGPAQHSIIFHMSKGELLPMWCGFVCVGVEPISLNIDKPNYYFMGTNIIIGTMNLDLIETFFCHNSFYVVVAVEFFFVFIFANFMIHNSKIGTWTNLNCTRLFRWRKVLAHNWICNLSIWIAETCWLQPTEFMTNDLLKSQADTM